MGSAFLLEGERVAIREPAPEDEAEFTAAAAASRAVHHPWLAAPDTAEKYAELMARVRREDTAGFVVCDRASGAIAGYVMINNIVMRNFRNGYLGYAVFEPFAGRGYLTEGVDLVIRYAFETIGVHRLEANIQPGNEPSRNLAKRLGLRLEGFSPGYLFIDGGWRDHERWAITVEMHRPAGPRAVS